MTDTTKRIILLSVGLAITAACISIYALVFGTSRREVEKVSSDQKQAVTDMSYYPITKYDGCVIWGSDAVTYCRTCFGKLPEIRINGSLLSSLASLRDATSPAFVDPVEYYMVEITYDANGVPYAAKITKK